MISSDDYWWWDCFISFAAGAFSVSLLWFWQVWQQQTFSLDVDALAAGSSLDDADDDSGWVDPWNVRATFQLIPIPTSILEDWTQSFANRIGELPVPVAWARGGETGERPKNPHNRWPWETIRRRVFSYKNQKQKQQQQQQQSQLQQEYGDEDDNARKSINNSTADYQDVDDDDFDLMTLPDEDDDDDDDKSEEFEDDEDNTERNDDLDRKLICIGSIFGLDVGGTLAKLVYFEHKPDDYDPLVTPREHHYTLAASAQVVMMARRGVTSDDDALLHRNPFLGKRSLRNASISTSHPSSPTKRPVLQRRRSLSVGCMARFRDLRNEQHHVPSSTNAAAATATTTTTATAKASNSPSNHTNKPAIPIHSEASELDLRHLNELRQDSLPDDLDKFRNSVHFEPQINGLAKSSSPSHNNDSNLKDGKEYPNNEANESTVASQSQTTPKSLPASPSNSMEINSSMKKSRSMFCLSEVQKKAEALDRFYNFARRLDSYQDSIRDHKLSFYSRELGGEFHFIHFETRWMKNAMDLIRVNNLHLNIAKMGATGGGAHKYAKDWERMLGIQMDKQEELDSLVAGMQFVLATVVGECYTFRPRQLGSLSSSGSSDFSSVDANHNNNRDSQAGAPVLGESASDDSEELSAADQQPQEGDEPPHKQQVDEWWWSRKVQRDAISYSSSYPYLLVTIGTGVSILRVDGPRKHERISGSTIGGGTYWGLIRLLTDVEDFDDAMKLAEKGNPAKVDMMVGDIYGKNSDALEKLGLPSNIVASSFGKLVAKEDPAAGLKQEDLARALLLMVTINIGQVAYLNAKLHKTSRIYFVGNFLRRNTISQRRLSYAIHYWSKGEMEALFLEHEGYFGALGAFLMSQNISQDEEGFFQWKDAPPPPSSDTMSESKSSHSLFHRRMKTFAA